jgi:hypothetical protein
MLSLAVAESLGVSGALAMMNLEEGVGNDFA